MAFIMDTGFWYASIDNSDEHHLTVGSIADSIHQKVIVPIPVITETAYLVQKNRGVSGLVAFSDSLAVTKFILEPPIDIDYVRTAAILRKYNDANIDFVDACIVAMAERLKITKILTVDRRHFGIFKPEHCDSFEILP